MQKIKRYLFEALGRERYLFLVSRIYFAAFRLGLLRKDPDYEVHYFISKLVGAGDQVMDIGANLGYYTVLFSDLVGEKGKVWSVEPVPLYRRVLQRNIGRRRNVEVVPYALGVQEGVVEMGVPGDQPYRHGLTRVLEPGSSGAVAGTFRAEVKDPAKIFGQLGRLDYIKCDVEGYEIHIIPQMAALIRRLRPLVQVELAAENREAIFHLFLAEDYVAFCVPGQKLLPLSEALRHATGDTIFLPSEQVGKYSLFIERLAG